jgi:hypothetical protein
LQKAHWWHTTKIYQPNSIGVTEILPLLPSSPASYQANRNSGDSAREGALPGSGVLKVSGMRDQFG